MTLTHGCALCCFRGGGGASDHVSVLGNDAMMVDVIKIATGHGATLQDSIVSDIDGIAARVQLWLDQAPAAIPPSASSSAVDHLAGSGACPVTDQ